MTKYDLRKPEQVQKWYAEMNQLYEEGKLRIKKQR